MKNKIKDIIATIVVALVIAIFILTVFFGEEVVIELKQVAIVVAGVAAILGTAFLCRLILKNKNRDE